MGSGQALLDWALALPAGAAGGGAPTPGAGVHQQPHPAPPGPQDGRAAAGPGHADPGLCHPHPELLHAACMRPCPLPTPGPSPALPLQPRCAHRDPPLPGCSRPCPPSPRSSACRTRTPSRSQWPRMPPATLISGANMGPAHRSSLEGAGGLVAQSWEQQGGTSACAQARCCHCWSCLRDWSEADLAAWLSALRLPHPRG